jgi:hypothetical protein
MRLPLLVLHITGGTLGVLFGFAAMFLRKGTSSHAVAGRVFVISMLTMSGCGAILAVMKSEPGNFLGGALTFCLVATAWVTARRQDWKPGAFDWSALLVTSALAAFALARGLQAALSATGPKSGDSAGPYFMLGSVALLAAVGDVRLVLRRAITPTQRLGRHLWRMCFAQFVAAASVFLARQRLFPVVFQKTGLLFILSFLPLVVMLLWMIRVRFTNRGIMVKPSNWGKALRRRGTIVLGVLRLRERDTGATSPRTSAALIR